MVTFSQYSTAKKKVTEIKARWESTERILGPAVEALPHLLPIPLLIFTWGVLCTAGNQQGGLLCVLVSTLLLVIIPGALSLTPIHAAHFPNQSPFHSSLSRFYVWLDEQVQSILSQMHPESWTRIVTNEMLSHFIGPFIPNRQPRDRITSDSKLAPSTEVFHQLVQEAHDSDTLELAVASVSNAIRWNPRRSEYFSAREDHRMEPIWHAQHSAQLLDIESLSLTHFLSRTASPRTKIAAAEAITDLALGIPRKCM